MNSAERGTWRKAGRRLGNASPPWVALTASESPPSDCESVRQSDDFSEPKPRDLRRLRACNRLRRLTPTPRAANERHDSPSQNSLWPQERKNVPSHPPRKVVSNAHDTNTPHSVKDKTFHLDEAGGEDPFDSRDFSLELQSRLPILSSDAVSKVDATRCRALCSGQLALDLAPWHGLCPAVSQYDSRSIRRIP